MLQSEPGTRLHLLVRDAARELCRVAMPLASVDNLEHLFPDEDLALVKLLGIDFAQIIERVRESEYAPQTLLDTQTPNRSYLIWIE